VIRGAAGSGSGNRVSRRAMGIGEVSNHAARREAHGAGSLRKRALACAQLQTGCAMRVAYGL
jgi:hypothetical protein